MTPSEKAQYYAGKPLPAGTRFSTYFKAPIPDGFGFRAVEPMAYSAGHDAWFGLVEQLDSGRIGRSGCAPEWVDWDSVPDPPQAQKYHHGDCTAHCRCARSNGKLGGQWRCEKHGAHGFSADGSGCAMCESERQTKPARRFCACGQELQGKWLTSWTGLCGDCVAQTVKMLSKATIDARIAAARAATDEAEGAWSTATSEGP